MENWLKSMKENQDVVFELIEGKRILRSKGSVYSIKGC